MSDSKREVCNAVISAATLRQERGFMLDSWIQVDYGDSGQGFGGFALYIGRSGAHHRVESFAGHWLWRVMEIAGCEDWEHVVGKAIRCRVEDGRILAIGHIIKDDWFEPAADFASAGLGVKP